MSRPIVATIVGLAVCVCAWAGGAQRAAYQIIAEKAEIYSLPELGFAYDALEPHIDEATLVAHHTGHHQAYCTKMNAALRDWRIEDPQNTFSTEPIVEILKNLEKVPASHRTSITNNGGGYVNHALYWATMSPHGGGQPTGQLLADIEAAFSNFDDFKEQFNKKALTLFGSGYVWLSRHGSDLVLSTTTNQDSPLSSGLSPILVLDVWEHAYYLQHQFRRGRHVDAWWSVVDWERVDALDAWWRRPAHNLPHMEL